jgi:hypothetical protein
MIHLPNDHKARIMLEVVGMARQGSEIETDEPLLYQLKSKSEPRPSR